MSKTHYQAIVLGAGPGGYPCAIRLGQLGVDTLIVEKESWGGVCLNVGCIPSKALITASKRLHEIQEAGAMGLQVEGEVSVDMAAMQDWKRGIVNKLTGGVSSLLEGNGVDQAIGTGRLTGAHEVSVTDSEGEESTYTADHIVLATGSRPIEIPGFSFSDPQVLDSTGALALGEIPERLVVIGGGYIGLELGGVYAKLGTEVTVVEMLDTVLSGFDEDAIRAVRRQLKRDGVTLLTNTRARSWEATDEGIAVQVETEDGERSLEADYVLVTVGRVPNSEDLGLEEVGVELDGRFVEVDEQRRSSLPHIFAIGDLAGQPMLAHKATHEGEIVAEIIHGRDIRYDARTVPAVVFTDPEVAVAGLMEHEAAEKGEIKVGKVPYAAVGRALTTNETTGFYKVIADAEDGRVLGITICGSHASDLISEAALAIEMDAEALDLSLTIHPHPTLGEGVMEAAKAALGEAVHVLNKR